MGSDRRSLTAPGFTGKTGGDSCGDQALEVTLRMAGGARRAVASFELAPASAGTWFVSSYLCHYSEGSESGGEGNRNVTTL